MIKLLDFKEWLKEQYISTNKYNSLTDVVKQRLIKQYDKYIEKEFKNDIIL